MKFLFLIIFAQIISVYCGPFDEADRNIAKIRLELDRLKSANPNTVFDWKFDPSDYNETKALQDAEEYDFIIVGAGASGAVIANRLSETPEWKILLLEAGPPETEITQIPALQVLMNNSPYEWGFTSVPQDTSCLGMIDRKCPIPSGKALGGNTATNDMIYTRGNSRDYDYWADAENAGWCSTGTLPYFKKIEDIDVKKIDKGYHHLGGPLRIEDPRCNYNLSTPTISAGEDLDYMNIDYNGKQQIGFATPQVTTKFGKRYSAAEAYLKPASCRKNLHIKTFSQVIQNLIGEHSKEVKGVKYLYNKELLVAKATKEVILSAGAINTPKLLLLSGIGPKDKLDKHKIKVLKELPVGEHLKDRTAFVGLNFVYNETKLPKANEYYAILDYHNYGKGPLTYVGVDVLGFIKTNHSKSKLDYPDIELMVVPTIHDRLKYSTFKSEIYNALWKPLENDNGFSINIILNHPKSSGNIELNNTDPLNQPLINLNQLSDEDDEDIETMLAGIKFAIRLTQTESFRKLGIKLNDNVIPECEDDEFGTDNYWTCTIPYLSVSLGHVSGTAKMGPKTDKTAVVDKELRVYGVEGLRIADASVIPVTISGHLMAAEYMIGEKASDLLIKCWEKSV